MTTPSAERPTPLPDRVRLAAAEVAGRATLVRIDHDALDRLATTIDPAPPEPLPEERYAGSDEDRARAVLVWNAVNFGSGWFPHIAKIPGLSGARTLGTRFYDHCRSAGVPDASTLVAADSAWVTDVFQQPTDGPAGELMGLFADAWRELGSLLLEQHDGRSLELVASAGGSGADLAARLATLPHWDDRHRHPGPTADADDGADRSRRGHHADLGTDPSIPGGSSIEVPLYKRAQIVVSNLASEFGRSGPGRFDDLHTLTAFADNLVPHVLKVRGVLVVAPELDARIEREELLISGEAGEVELRAVAVHAVELLVGELRGRGHDHVTAASVDHRLWRMGQDPTFKARPRHRCRCTFY